MNQTPTERTAATVRAELARRNVTARQLCVATGMKPATLSRRLKAEHPFRVDELGKIAAHLGLPISTLLPDSSANHT